MGKNPNVLFALFGGLAIGAAIGILLAPEKGAETRKKVSEAVRKAADRIKEGMKSTPASDIDNPVA
ncbi:MAG: YtxH domain-containing protein [Bacteroidota bacterium]